MANTVNDALQHLDALLSVEADALTDDELLLVTDMVQQLVGGPSAAAGQQQHLLSTPAGSNLAAQIEQMLPGVMQMAQQQSQQPQPQTLSTAALTAQNLQYQGVQRAQPVGAAHPGFCSSLVLNSQPHLRASLQPTDASGLAEPSDSSMSGRSSPVSPQSRPLTKFMGSPQHPAAARPVPAAPAQPDAAVQAAADVLTAALTDPNASIAEIVGIFDSVLTAGELDAKELQQRLASPQPHQQPVHAQYQQPLQHLQAQPLLPAQQQQYPAQDYQQQAPAQCGSPVLAADSKQSALQAYLQEQQGSHDQPVLNSSFSAGSPPARTPNSQWQPSSRLSMPVATEWQPDRPSTAPAQASSQYPASQGASVSLRGSNHSAASTSPSTALMAAAAARRSQSPDVFRRLSVMSTASATAKQAAVQTSARNSDAAHEIQRNWLGTLRGSGEKSPQPARDRSSSRGRDSCASEQQQQSAEEVPWLTAAEVQSARQSGPLMSPGPMEWDADSRSIKAGSGGGWVNSTRGRSPARASDGEEKDPAVPQKQPLKLPKHVIEERMRRFYARNVDWKDRCAQVYKRQREQQQQGEVVECTFAPTINKKSEKMAQELRTSYPMKPIRPITPLANAAEEVEQQLRKQQLLQQQCRSASTGRMRQKQQLQGWMYGSGNSCTSPGSGSSSGGGADQAIPPAAKRLFQDATVRMQRAEQFKKVTEQAERKARSWSAPRRPGAEVVPPRVYDHLDPQRSSSKQRSQKHPAGEECLFKPWTNPRRKPKSAQHSGARAAQEEDKADEQELEEFVAMLAEQQQQQQQQRRPGTAPTGGHTRQPRSPSASRRIGSATKNTDLDWDEFIDRQSMFIRAKQAKVAAVTDREYSRSLSPELSPGTKRILKGKQALAENCGSPSHTHSGPYSPVSPQKQQDFLGRLQQESESHASSGGGSPGVPESPGARRAGKTSAGGSSTATSGRSGNGTSSGGGWTSDEHTFKPRITLKAAAKKARSFEEMSEGDRLRREVRLEQLRVLKEAKELAAVTFRPDLSPSRQRAGGDFAAVPPKISMTSEGLSAYMASLQEKRRQLEERRKKAEARQQEEEIRECTFKPETTPVPAYITEMAEVGYTARYIDRVMQGALTDGRVGSTVAAVAKALKPSDGGRQVSPAVQETSSAGGSPQKPLMISSKY